MDNLSTGSSFAGLTRPLHNVQDGRFEDFEFGIGRTDGKALLLDADDSADDAAGRLDFITGPQAFDQGVVQFLFLPLRTEEKEIENDRQEEQRQIVEERRGVGLLPRWGAHRQNCVCRAQYHNSQ